MAERGFRADRAAAHFVGDESWCAPPLQMVWSMVIEPYRYGGLRFDGHATVRADDVRRQLWQFSDEALNPALVISRNRPTSTAPISLVTTGQLTDPRGNFKAWVVQEESDNAPALIEFFAAVDGPLRSWAAPRHDVSTLLDNVFGALAEEAANSMSVRSLALLALDHGRADVCRELLARYRPEATDTAEHVAAFERELIERHPDHGAAQLS
jgi:hypothetical protein